MVGTGRRERKKQGTRWALMDAAVRLFAERGYDATSVLDITEAADVSKRTFFLHFPTKDDVLFADGPARLAMAVGSIEDRPPGTTLRDALAAAFDTIIVDTAAAELPDGLSALRARLIATTPAVQSRLLHSLFTAQTHIAEAVHKAYPDLVDELTAASIVGSVTGAITAAAVESLRQGHSPAETHLVMCDAAALALGGLPH